QRTPSSARSRSASPMTIIAFFPPISSERRLCIRPQVAPMTDPVSVDPVNEITGTSGCSTSARPTTEPCPCTSWTTSGGSPASSSTSTSRCAVCGTAARGRPRSEEHTSELQSRGHVVCRLLLEKKKEQFGALDEHGVRAIADGVVEKANLRYNAADGKLEALNRRSRRHAWVASGHERCITAAAA